MNAAKGCEAEKGMERVTHVAWSPNILVDPPTDRRRFGPWQNQSPMAIDEGMECDDFRRHTLLTSPRRSIIRCSAFLVSPILPSKNTISGTRSRSVQILYA
jgi:hypothetical protein